jgi:hypothetical protein
VKAEFGPPRTPVKWNMKDLQAIYEEQKQGALYEKLLKSSAEWRTKIFQCLADADVKIIIACIESYSADKKVQVKTKEGLVRYAFSNGLMRFGLLAQESSAEAPMVVLDWPEKADPKPFNFEYACAYVNGKTSNEKVEYSCGKLSALGFADSAVFTSMRHSTILQAADLVVGATREFIECSLEKKGPGQGVECLKIIKAKFRGAPDNIIGRGISISSGNEGLGEKVAAGLKNYL